MDENPDQTATPADETTEITETTAEAVETPEETSVSAENTAPETDEETATSEINEDASDADEEAPEAGPSSDASSPEPTNRSDASSLEPTNRFDVFHWANEVDEIKNNVSAELFLFNKNYTPYKIRYSDGLTNSVKSMFMNEAIQYIIEGADKGLECREYEKADGEEKVIYHTKLERVGRAETLIHLIEHEYSDINYFSENEYDFKKVKGIIAKFTYPGGQGTKTFYIAKLISASSALKGGSSWEINGESFEPFSAEIALKMPEDNQVAIIEGTVVVFNQAKFENLFQYDFKSQVLAEEKARELTEKYKLSFAEGLTLDGLLQDKKPILKKVQAMDIAEEMPQDKLLEYADEMQLDLMSDDDGSIIIMDDKDLTTFVNLVNEDYYISPVNGRRYEIKSKKLLSDPEGEPPRG